MNHPLTFICLGALALFLSEFQRGVIRESALNLRVRFYMLEGLRMGLGIALMGGISYAISRYEVAEPFREFLFPAFIVLAYGYSKFVRLDGPSAIITAWGASLLHDRHFDKHVLSLFILSAVLVAGISLLRVMVASIQYRMLFARIPKLMKGYPAFFIAAALAVLALWVFEPALDLRLK